LDGSEYKLPYYEVDYNTPLSEDHTVYFVVPCNRIGSIDNFKEVVDVCNSYALGPYYNHIKAIKEDSKKRGLPIEIEVAR
jgi:hypothetical protein